jgi:hypothetical protein
MTTTTSGERCASRGADVSREVIEHHARFCGELRRPCREKFGGWGGLDRIRRPAPRPTDDMDRITRAASLPGARAVLFCTVSKRRRGVWRFLARAARLATSACSGQE